MSNYKVGDKIIRIEKERYSIVAPAGSPFWRATIITHVAHLTYEVLCDDGTITTWSEAYFKPLTKLEQALL